MTSSSQKRLVWVFIAAAPAIFLALAALQVRIDNRTRSFATSKEELVLRSGAALKKASLGYDALMADIYWTRAVQYFGGRSTKSGQQMELLDPLLDITTTLDPRLVIAYRFGAIFLSEPAPIGAGRPDLAVKLVKKGIAANPNEWQLYSDLAFIYYWHLDDSTNAAAAFLAGSKVPNAPEYLSIMAARVSQSGGEIENSILIWRQIYQSTKNPKMQEEAERQIAGLTAVHDEQILNKLSDDYRQRFGRYPASSQDLVDAKILPGIPADPAGLPYVFGPDGKARLNPASPVVIPAPPKRLLGR